MSPNTRTAEIFVFSKPINFYVYSTLTTLGAMGAGLLFAYFKDGGLGGKTMSILTPLLGVILFSYYIRFWAVRNIRSLREKIVATESEEEALNLVMGGVKWGLVAFAAVSVTFYFSIRPYL